REREEAVDAGTVLRMWSSRAAQGGRSTMRLRRLTTRKLSRYRLVTRRPSLHALESRFNLGGRLVDAPNLATPFCKRIVHYEPLFALVKLLPQLEILEPIPNLIEGLA